MAKNSNQIISQAVQQELLKRNVDEDDDEKKQLKLINLNPYPGLIRLLDHSDENVVSDAISSIYNLLQCGTDTTPSDLLHPHFEKISAAGIEKLLELFQKSNQNTKVKDKIALCIGRLFRAKEIQNQQMKEQVIGYLISLLYVPDQWAIDQSQIVCMGLVQNEDHPDENVVSDSISSIYNLLQCGTDTTPSDLLHPHFEIIQEEDGIEKLLELFQKSNQNTKVKDKIALCIGRLFRAKEIQNQQMKEQVIGYLISLLYVPDQWAIDQSQIVCMGLVQNEDHPDENVVSDSISSIYNLLLFGTNTSPLDSQHPHFKQISEADGIEKMILLFLRSDQNQNIKDTSALCIGILF
ncbi:MAG: hypothetical protein EZS28_011048 [Streblomastix strix]|uniref:Armadillo-type fold n=1 Tax=Streblomastix strix TaxID=222440 RepID=A0A5J4WGE8_9EUKA|nr:MAG: hypothetical protein EZS28_011048 [Streblomastix strix]